MEVALQYAIPATEGLIAIIGPLIQNRAALSDQLETLRADINTTKAIVFHIDQKRPRNPYVQKWMNNVTKAISDCERLLKRFQDPDSGTNNSTNLTCLYLRRPNDMRKLGKMRKKFHNFARQQEIILQVCNNEGSSFISRLLISGGVLGVIGAALIVVFV